MMNKEQRLVEEFRIREELYGNDMLDDIGYREGEYIRKYLPFLNTQIPKQENYHNYDYNKRAKYITLDSILYEGKLKNSH